MWPDLTNYRCKEFYPILQICVGNSGVRPKHLLIFVLLIYFYFGHLLRNRLAKPMVNFQHKVWSSRYSPVITVVVELSVRKE